MEQFTELLMMALPIITNVLYWVVVIAIVVHFIAAFLIISSWGSAPRHLEWKIIFHQGALLLMATVIMSSFVWWNPFQVPLPFAAPLVLLGLWLITKVSALNERLEQARRRDLAARGTYNHFRPHP